MNRLNAEKINELKQLTLAGMSQRGIAERVGVSAATVRRYIRLDKGELPSWHCKECSVDNPKGAKFCNQCGSKLLTTREETVNNLKSLIKLAGALPENSRDLYITTLKNAIKYLNTLED